MILISHRGNINGKNPEKENTMDYIFDALDAGYHCEIDVHYDNHKWFLGHDKPSQPIHETFLLFNNLWLHAKTIITIHELMKLDNVNCFYHEKDACVLTSKGYIWTYPGYTLGKRGALNNSICVLPELYPEIEEFNCVGICSDFIGIYKVK
jgi:hypothetical protein